MQTVLEAIILYKKKKYRIEAIHESRMHTMTSVARITLTQQSSHKYRSGKADDKKKGKRRDMSVSEMRDKACVQTFP